MELVPHHVQAVGEMVTSQPSPEAVKRKSWVISHIGILVTLPNSKHYTSNVNITSGLHLSLSCKEIKVLNNHCSLGGRKPKLWR